MCVYLYMYMSVCQVQLSLSLSLTSQVQVVETIKQVPKPMMKQVEKQAGPKR